MSLDNKQTLNIAYDLRRRDIARLLMWVVLLSSLAGCLNTKSVAFEEQPPALSSPADACREAAVAEGWTVVDVRDVREVSAGYWEARFVVDDPELRSSLGCRHSVDGQFTEIVRLDG